MKKMLANFENDYLSRKEMKNISGGRCAVCSTGPTGGTCGSAIFSRSEARDMADEFNGFNDGYSYYTNCNIE